MNIIKGIIMFFLLLLFLNITLHYMVFDASNSLYKEKSYRNKYRPV